MARRTHQATASRGLRGAHPRHRHQGRDGVLVPRVRLLRHLLPGAARRPRRAQAGPAPHPLHDGRDEPAARPRARQERPRRRRGHGPPAPARRRRDLRRPGPAGPALVDAAADRRRARQLRLARRPPGRDALHRVPDGRARGGDDGLHRRGHRRLQAQLRRPRDRADRSCRRRSRTSSSTAPTGIAVGHGHQHRPAQPRRGRPGAAPPDRAPRGHPRRPDAVRPRPRPAHRRQDRRARRRPRRLRDRPRHVPDARHRPGRDRRPPQGHRRHRAPLRRRHREGHRAHQDPGPGQEAAGHRRHQGPHRPGTRACGWSSRSRTASTPRRCSSSSTGRRRWRTPSASTPSRWSTGSRARSGSRSCSRSSSATATTSYAAARSFRRGKAADRLHLVDGLLIAHPRHRRGHPADPHLRQRRGRQGAAHRGLRPVEVQADYILDMPLRRLTRFSRIELEKERDELRATIEELDAILADEALLREVVSDELAEVAKTFGTPRRTVLLESAGAAASPRPPSPLEVADDPCLVLLSSTGLLARTANAEPPGDGRRPGQARRRGRRRSAPPPAARSASSRRAGRLVRLGVLELPALPATANDPHLAGRRPRHRGPVLEPGERLLALCTLADRRARASPSAPGRAWSSGSTPRCSATDDWEVIGLRRRRRGRRRGRAAPPATRRSASSPATPSCCTSAPTASGRRAGRAAAWPASGSPREQRSRWFGARRPATPMRSWSPSPARRRRCPAPSRARSRSRRSAEYPAKGRATGGVRCHRFLKGEDTLVLAWAGAAPARAAAASGAPVDLPEATGRRDGSGVPGQPADRGLRGPAWPQRRPSVWEADAMNARPSPTAGPPARGRRDRLALDRLLRRRRRRRRRRRADARGGAGRGQDDARRDQRRPDRPRAPTPLPEGVQAWPAASGVVTNAPAFEGDIEVVLAGTGRRVPVIAVDGVL